jgi:hypothetical protein
MILVVEVKEGTMPSTRETISQTQAGDYTQTTTADLEDGTIRVAIAGPAGTIETDARSAREIDAQLAQLEQAIAAARAVLEPLVEYENQSDASR